jgi:hypothetical protein
MMTNSGERKTVSDESIVLMGLFRESIETADAIDDLYTLGIPEDDIIVMTGVPYPGQSLGRSREWIRLPYIVLAGGLTGFLFGLFLSVITPLLYPLHVGGRPIVAGPPALVIIYVFTMMATIVSTFLGVIWEMGFPTFVRKYYHKLVTAGHLAVLLECQKSEQQEVTSILEAHGGHNIHQPEKIQL